MLEGDYVRLAWNENESKWTMTAGQALRTDISGAVTGEWDDGSLRFVDDSDRTWTAKRYAVADKLALDGEMKQWVEGKGYLTEETEPGFAAVSSTFLTEHQSLEGYATSAYVNEGHGYTFTDPLTTTDLHGGGKVIGLSGVCLTKDYYNKFVFNQCLSAVRQYDSPEQIPLSAVVNAIWCLGKL